MHPNQKMYLGLLALCVLYALVMAAVRWLVKSVL